MSSRFPSSDASLGVTTGVKRLARLAGFFLLLATGLFLVISPRTAERFLFFPSSSDPGPAPTLAGVSGVDQDLRAGDGVMVHAWWFEAAPDAPAVLFLHGNAGTIADRRFQADAMLERGISVLLLSYRGYGRSGGRPTEAGVGLDAAAALDFVEARTGGRDRIVLHGRSLGGAVAARLAREREGVAGVVLESTFTSLEDIAASAYALLPRFFFRRLRGRFDTRDAVRGLRAPLLVVHGDRDRLIPSAMGRELADLGPGSVELVEVPGADHNDLPFVGGPAYFDLIARFVHDVTGPSRDPAPPRPDTDSET